MGFFPSSTGEPHLKYRVPHTGLLNMRDMGILECVLQSAMNDEGIGALRRESERDGIIQLGEGKAQGCTDYTDIHAYKYLMRGR